MTVHSLDVARVYRAALDKVRALESELPWLPRFDFSRLPKREPNEHEAMWRHRQLATVQEHYERVLASLQGRTT